MISEGSCDTKDWCNDAEDWSNDDIVYPLYLSLKKFTKLQPIIEV